MEPKPLDSDLIGLVVRAAPPRMLTAPRRAEEAAAGAIVDLARANGWPPKIAAEWLAGRLATYVRQTRENPSGYSLHGWIRDRGYDAPGLARSPADDVASVDAAVAAQRRAAAAVRRAAVPPPTHDPDSPIGRRLAALRRGRGEDHPEVIPSASEPSP